MVVVRRQKKGKGKEEGETIKHRGTQEVMEAAPQIMDDPSRTTIPPVSP